MQRPLHRALGIQNSRKDFDDSDDLVEKTKMWKDDGVFEVLESLSLGCTPFHGNDFANSDDSVIYLLLKSHSKDFAVSDVV